MYIIIYKVSYKELEIFWAHIEICEYMYVYLYVSLWERNLV